MLDYDDLLLYFAQMLTEPAIAAEIAGRFDHLLVDEYQDTNALQGEIVLALRPQGRGLTVVGDDAQAIYSFRAATVRNILDFPRAFDPPALIVTLERNYRSSGAVLAAANAAIALAPERFAKNPLDRAAGGRAPDARHRRRRRRSGALRRHPRARQSRGGRFAEKPGGAVSRLPPQRRARTRAYPPQRAVRQIRRPEVSRRRACERCGGADALRREPARPGCGLSRRPASARRRAEDRRDDRRRGGRRRRVCGDGGLVAPGAGARRLSRLRRTHAPARRPRRAMAGGDRRRRRLALAADRDALRRRAGPDGRSRGARAHRRLVFHRASAF